MSSLWTSFPMLTCPHCGKEFQVDDYFEYEDDDSLDCGRCGEEIFILQTETVIEVKLGTEKETP